MPELELNTLSLLWVVPALPLLGFVCNSLWGRYANKNLVAFIATGLVGLSFLISLNLFLHLLSIGSFKQQLYTWAVLNGFSIQINLAFNQLSAILVLIITGIGTLIHLYSIYYMQGAANYRKFFGFLNLFIFFMLVLVLADNLLLVFVGWEGVGLCSYLLIGFEYERRAAEKAARYAFILNRVGDLGFMLAMLISLHAFGTLDLESLNQQAQNSDSVALEWLALALLFAATGKSAQIPLYTWLPDAMEGPTPVSALIHAATMVTAGIYLISQLSYVFAAAPVTTSIIMWVGGSTALLAAVVACFQSDIKKVLAYSTISQLGYMFLALGVGAFSAAVFHLLTHAFFKALLFLAAGALIHSLHKQDLFKMGQLKAKLPLLWLSFAIGSWAIAGLPLAAGFFSKDAILTAVFAKSPGWWLVGLLTAGLTAFYMYRLVNLAFYSADAQKTTSADAQKTTSADAQKTTSADAQKTTSEDSEFSSVPLGMMLVLIILSLGSVLVGYLSIPESFGTGAHNVWSAFFENYFATQAAYLSPSTEHGLTAAAILVAILGLGFAAFLYKKEPHKMFFGRKLLVSVQPIISNALGLNANYWRFAQTLHASSKLVLKRYSEPMFSMLLNFYTHGPYLLGSVVQRLHSGNILLYFLLSILAMLLFLSFASGSLNWLKAYVG